MWERERRQEREGERERERKKREWGREGERGGDRDSETIDKCGLVPKCVRIIGPKLMIDIEREAERIILNGLKGGEINR